MNEVKNGEIWKSYTSIYKVVNIVVNPPHAKQATLIDLNNNTQHIWPCWAISELFDFCEETEIQDLLIEKKTKNKYHRNLKGLTVDVYDVLKAFEVTDPALQHLIKKALCAGLRGHKNKTQDLQDILDSAKRALDLNK